MELNGKILEELINIKKLLIMHLIKNGTNGKNIGELLGLSKSRISQLVPSRKVKGKRP